MLSVRGSEPPPTVAPITSVRRAKPRVSPDEFELDVIKKPPTLGASMSETNITSGRHPLEHSLSLPTKTQHSVEQTTLSRKYKLTTGRSEAQDITTTEAKPDWWKIAYLSIQFMRVKFNSKLIVIMILY